MNDRKDYYQILGITDDEKKLQGKDFEKVLKGRFKKIALSAHPDRNQGKSEDERKKLEEEFKEASEAYDTLLNHRDEYDNPQSNFNFGGFDASKINDLLKEYGFGRSRFGFDDFGFGFGNQQENRVQKGQSMRIRINVTLEDIYNGIDKTIKYNRMDKCHTCGGSGKTKDSKIEQCKHCGGTGTMFTQSGFGANGFVQRITTCPYCNGSGTILINPCKTCGGSGLVQTQNTVNIKIPKGISDGSQMLFQNGGNAPSNGEGVYGDLLVVINEIPNKKFERDGNDLYFIMEVPIIDAMLGCNVEVTTIDGKKLTTKLHQGTNNGDKIRFSKKGMPIMNTNNYGDMYGIVKLKMPKKLNNDEVQLLNLLKEKENFKK